MSFVLRVDDEKIDAHRFVKYLKLSNQFEGLADQLARDRIIVAEAVKHGLTVSGEELQQAADDMRRVLGLHRAKDTLLWLEAMDLTLDDLEAFLRDGLYKKKLRVALVTQQAIARHFSLHGPKFDKADLRVISVRGLAQAREIMAQAEEDSEGFAEMARNHSLDELTRDDGGLVRGVRRGSLHGELEDKVFTAAPGTVLGPFSLEEDDFYQVVLVEAHHPARLDQGLSEEIADEVFDAWLLSRLSEHSVQLS